MYFVDKSALIEELIPALGKKNRYFCITRPRRFGKSVIANMVAAFFGRAVEAGRLFKGQKISENAACLEYQNKYNVIFIDFSDVPEKCGSYDAYLTRILNGLKDDLYKAYSDMEIDVRASVWDILNAVFQEKGEKFILYWMSGMRFFIWNLQQIQTGRNICYF